MTESMQDFYEMFEASMKRINNGDMVEGTIEEVSEDAAIVDIGSYMDGILLKEQLADGESMSDLKVGQKIKARVKRVDTRNSQIYLSKRDADKIAAWHELERHKETGEAVMVKVEQAVKGGLRVKCAGALGFMPASQVDLSYVEDLESYVGQELEAEIMEIDSEKHDFTVSRKSLLKKLQEEEKKRLFESLSVGDRVHGEVKRVESYGAFVDLGHDVRGLIHVGEMAWHRVSDPHEIVSVGDEVEAVVVKLDEENERIGLSLKMAEEDPFLNPPFAVGDVVADCEVIKTIKNGAFVKVSEDLEGFLPISEMSYKRIQTVREAVSEGQKISVKVLSIDRENRRISLSLKQAVEQPKNEEEPSISFFSTDSLEEAADTEEETLMGKAMEGLHLDGLMNEANEEE